MSVVQSVTAPPLVSVLMPVYNSERYVQEALDSILGQTFSDFELLVLDDGSTDGSLNILKSYEAKDPRVRVNARRHLGTVQTRIELAKDAKGYYLAIMDADDVCLPDRFERQVKFLDASPEYVAVGSYIEQMSGAGQPIGVLKSPIEHEKIDRAHLKGHCSITNPSAMIKAAALVKAGGHNPDFHYAEDLDLWLRLAEVGKLANIPEVLLRVRLTPSGMTESAGRRQLDYMRKACEMAWARRGVAGVFEPNEHWRPAKDRLSRHKFALQYGWIAWAHSHRDTWWDYARTALRLRPLALSSWRLLIFGLLKKPPKQLRPKS